MRLSSFNDNIPGRWTYGSLFFLGEETELRKAGEQKEEEERKIKIEQALGFCRHFSHVKEDPLSPPNTLKKQLLQAHFTDEETET